MIVIADDITGAAEIAGIAHRLGQQVRLLTTTPVSGDFFDANVITVIATDTRSMTEAESVAETRRLTSHLLPLSAHLFKKTDSALRGHVVAELAALMQAAGYRRAVYLPANPSKGRVIRNGIYYIDQKPIHQTAFSFDPEFPATTSVLSERFPDADSQGIVMPDGETLDDLHRVITDYDDGHTLFAGAADLFTCLIGNKDTSGQVSDDGDSLLQGSILIVCGSTQSRPLGFGIPISPMPDVLYDGSCDVSLWDGRAYEQQHSLILTIPQRHRTGHVAAVHLRTMTARMVARLVAVHRPDNLVIEGGATAYAILRQLGWNDLTVTREIAPGVVRMRAACGTTVTLKPGSYPMGAIIHSLAH